MKKAILIIVILGMVGWAVFDLTSSSGSSAKGEKATEENDLETTDEVGLSRGQTAPDFELESAEGEVVSLSDYRGKTVIVNFWATWCPPCRAEIPDFQKLYDKNDVVILAVNLTETEAHGDDISDFISEYEMTFPVLMDVESEVATAYEVHAYPTSYMIDSNGHIEFVAIGAMNYDFMVQQLEKMK